MSSAGQGRNVPLPEFHDRITTSDVMMIDVREPQEVKAVRVNAKNYVNIPLRVFENALIMDPDSFKQAYKVGKPSKNDQILLICRSGNRSDQAVTIARKLNFNCASHFNGGTSGYERAYPNEVIKE